MKRCATVSGSSKEDFVKPFHEAKKVFGESPEEFAIRIADDQADSIKLVNPIIKAIIVLSDFKKDRLPQKTREG